MLEFVCYAVMGFVTYVLLTGVVLGTQQKLVQIRNDFLKLNHNNRSHNLLYSSI